MSISFEARLRTHGSELHNLYNEIYHDEGAWEYFSGVLRRCFEESRLCVSRMKNAFRSPAGIKAASCLA